MSDTPWVRCAKCRRVRRSSGEDWQPRDTAVLAREVEGICRTCMDLLKRVADIRWQRQSGELLRRRAHGYADMAPVGDVFEGFREGDEVKIGAAFPGNYLKAADLQGKRVQVTIERVEMEDIGGDQKPVLHFRGKDRGLVLNKTNANAVWGINGSDDTDDWSGTTIVLYPSKTDFQGKRVDCIRVDPPHAEQVRRPQPPPAETDDDESIPF